MSLSWQSHSILMQRTKTSRLSSNIWKETLTGWHTTGWTQLWVHLFLNGFSLGSLVFFYMLVGELAKQRVPCNAWVSPPCAQCPQNKLHHDFS